MNVPFVSFKPMEKELDSDLRAAFERVYTASWYIEGKSPTICREGENGDTALHLAYLWGSTLAEVGEKEKCTPAGKT